MSSDVYNHGYQNAGIKLNYFIGHKLATNIYIYVLKVSVYILTIANNLSRLKFL